MPVSETVPSHLQAPAEAARAWFSEQQNSEFKVTGIVDPVVADDTGQFQLQLILCGEQNGTDVCLKEDFQVIPASDSFQVTHSGSDKPDIGSPAPELDPPAGHRQGWLESVLGRHKFVVLLFYRGLW